MEGEAGFDDDSKVICKQATTGRNVKTFFYMKSFQLKGHSNQGTVILEHL